MKVKQSLLKFISPETPEEIKLKVAKVQPPEPLSPEDQVTALVVLGFDKNSTVSEAAKKGLFEYPAERLLEALEKKLDPLVIKKTVSMHGENDAVIIMAAMNPGTDDETMKTIAETGPEEVAAVFIDEIETVRGKPFIIESLRKNPRAARLVIDEIETRLSAPAAEQTDRHKPPEKEDALAASMKDDKKEVDEHNMYQAVKNMSMGQKIKLALSGSKSAREFLVKDSNKMVSLAVLKNPRITEDEVLKVANTKGTPEDLLRHIARNKEWVKSYSVKIGMISNPKTPLPISMKLLDSLYEKDLQKICKSKNIPSVLASAARRKLDSKGKK
ncbi:MAG: hypothetical protein HY889_03435 [Deltaproteobacteria bacterium]|nr:hypothetical protein [Deltaproteobacteria bacterium]